jgi:homospermidine synthase
MAQIHHDMVNFKAKILAELEETEKEGQREFEKLRKMLRMDRVQCQEVNIRLKRQCEELKEIDRAYKVNF